MESVITIYDPSKGTVEELRRLEKAINNELHNLDLWQLREVYRFMVNIQR